MYRIYYKHTIVLGLFRALFGPRKKFPKKPSHGRMTTLALAMLSGWLVVREKITEMFGICKDPEFLLFRYFLDNCLPVVIYFYAVIHRGNLYQFWQPAMINLTIMFIIQQRHNYNKAMLATISDTMQYQTIIPEWNAVFPPFMTVFSEKKVEIFHSLLRMQCPPWTGPEQIIEIARVLSARKFDTEFSTHFLSAALQKQENQNITYLTGKAAEYLSNAFTQIYTTCGNSVILPKKRSKKGKKFSSTF